MNYLKGILIILIIIIFQSTILSYQINYSYNLRDKNRMEGRKRIDVRAPDIELLSFIGYKENVSHDTSVVLKIRFYLQKDTTLYITAKELRVQEFYLMKPVKINWSKGWNEFTPWPMQAVLKPLRITLDELGIIGRIGREEPGSGEITPLFVYHSKLPKKIHQYTLHFLPREDLRRVEYKLYKIDQNNPIISDHVIRLFGGVPFSIKLDLLDQSSGYYKLILDCEYKNKIGGPYREYVFFHNFKIKI